MTALDQARTNRATLLRPRSDVFSLLRVKFNLFRFRAQSRCIQTLARLGERSVWAATVFRYKNGGGFQDQEPPLRPRDALDQRSRQDAAHRLGAKRTLGGSFEF